MSMKTIVINGRRYRQVGDNLWEDVLTGAVIGGVLDALVGGGDSLVDGIIGGAVGGGLLGGMVGGILGGLFGDDD